MFVIVFCLLVCTSQCVLSENDPFIIGGIFYEDEAANLTSALEVSSRKFNFTAVVKTVQRGQILKISRSICELAQEGVIGIIDGLGGRGTEHIQALCDMLELPHVTVQANDLYARNWSVVNMYPSADAYNSVLRDIITRKDWNNFTLLYEKGYSLRLMSSLMEMGNSTDPFCISVRELSGDNYRDVLINAKDQGYSNFVVDCPSEKLGQLLLHAQQVGLMADEHSYIFLSPDLFTLDLNRYRYGGVNMTGFRLSNMERNPELWEFTSLLNNETGYEFKADNIKTKYILIYDAIKVFREALDKILKNSSLTAQPLDCVKYEAWTYGSTLQNFMKTNIVNGITRTLAFDGLGERDYVIFDVLELTPSGNQSVGTWKENVLNMSRPYVPMMEISEDSIMKNKTFKVLIALTPPFAYLKQSYTELVGNDQYEGFAVDLIDKMSKSLQFNYELEVEKNYTIMALKLMEDKAEFVICDFTMTVDRQKLIDFSTPFMSLGIGILYKEPSKQPPPMFSFMAVFSKEVWLWMLFIQMSIGVIMIFVGRISNKEWQNPVPCVELPEELSNQFSFANSIWLIIGSVMQQGSEIAPIALAPRMITSIWWFFTMVIMASYVGTLVAFLTVEKNVLPFTTADELADQKSIMYGIKEDGSTETFFKQSTNPVHKILYQNMKKYKWLTRSNDEGVEMAEKNPYAFFTESSAIEYYRQRHCDLLQVGDLLDSKNFGIGMKKNSQYKKFIDDALLKLKESGELQDMQDLWWKEKRGGGKCGEKKTEDAKQLSMKNMIGAFVVLYAGCLIGLCIAILDMLWGVFKRSVKYNTTFKYELVEELKFAVKFRGDVKPVKRPPKSAEGSEEALADAEITKDEIKDELGSLRSARTGLTGRSTSTRRSVHSHCSRHSPSDISVAFARRRKYS